MLKPGLYITSYIIFFLLCLCSDRILSTLNAPQDSLDLLCAEVSELFASAVILCLRGKTQDRKVIAVYT